MEELDIEPEGEKTQQSGPSSGKAQKSTPKPYSKTQRDEEAKDFQKEAARRIKNEPETTRALSRLLDDKQNKVEEIKNEILERMKSTRPGRYSERNLFAEMVRMGVPAELIEPLAMGLAQVKILRERHKGRTADLKRETQNTKMRRHRVAQKTTGVDDLDVYQTFSISERFAWNQLQKNALSLEEDAEGISKELEAKAGQEIAAICIAEMMVSKEEEKLKNLKEVTAHFASTYDASLEPVTAFIAQLFTHITGRQDRGIVGMVLYAAGLEEVKPGTSPEDALKVLWERVDERLKTPKSKGYLKIFSEKLPNFGESA